MNTRVEKVFIRPSGNLHTLSYQEAQQLCDASNSGLNDLFKQCALAVLNTGSKEDSSFAHVALFPNFEIKVHVKGRGVQMEIDHPPSNAFVNGEMIAGLQEHLSSVIRDLLYAQNQIMKHDEFDLQHSFGITNAVFHLARNAQLLKADINPNIVVCWGGHAISLQEYKYAKHVGYHLGLRKLDICTGCGPGAMKGPMKGAVLGHGKQRYNQGRYIGLTEPGIIAAEAPNAIVNELAIFPDIEKRLEAFVRLGHGIIIFPGGAGTMEEILYLMAILLNPVNQNIPFPVAFSAPESHRAYFDAVLSFLDLALGAEATSKIQVFIEDAEGTADFLKDGIQTVREFRKVTSDAYYFNWNLHIADDLQHPFEPTHENVKALNLTKNQPPYKLAGQLRSAFSAIVAGNVKKEGVASVERFGPFEIYGDADIMEAMDTLLLQFVEQRRMKLGDEAYQPCYKIVTEL